MKLTGNTPIERKRNLAHIVIEHLLALNIKAKLIENHRNSIGHTARFLIDSDIGLIHLTATGNKAPNSSIAVAEFKTGNQDYLADIKYIAYGWNTADDQTVLAFVKSKDVGGHKRLSKGKIIELSDKKLSTDHLCQ
ncbi:hypothetical protein JQC92_01270 [Shewanella sp. 202IG2-18]|uniref:hypothetical protein n=1 Tax=Parashewanella hymeniacidonis TaxID=2807618 RepID=UPI00195FCDFB|nr:hypothetical protein [Parashewanella hymeniacidonis]MBM7070673.1 hypothetical protein [Parashewanella hymeniacidonis]